MLRSVLAIVGGFITITVLSLGTDVLLMSIAPAWLTGNGGTTHPLPLVLALIYSFGLLTASGLFTAWMRGGRNTSTPRMIYTGKN